MTKGTYVGFLKLKRGVGEQAGRDESRWACGVDRA
jgi:hypothetical protein